MWARVIEIVLGLWLGLSAILFGAAAPALVLVLKVTLGAAVVALAASSFARGPYRYNHLAIVGIALALIAWGWLQTPRPGPGWAQEAIVVGLLLGLFAIVPTEAGRAPPAWRPYLSARNDDSR